MVNEYLEGLRPKNAYRNSAVLALVNRLAPRRNHWWEFWRYSDEHRYLLAFELIGFYIQAKS